MIYKKNLEVLGVWVTVISNIYAHLIKEEIVNLKNLLQLFSKAEKWNMTWKA